MGYLYLDKLAKELSDLEAPLEDEDELDEDERERLTALRKLDDQLFTSMDEYAANESLLIPEEEFEDYCQQWASDCGYAESESSPLSWYIDWERWADDMKIDFTEVEFEGDTYLIRTY